jgi:tRNA/rRNA methyltransferase
MTFWAYILRCNDGTYYTGHTDDLDVRLHQHQTGALKGYTYKRRPVELMWSQNFDTRDDAFTAEMQVKNWSKPKKEALIAGQYGRLSYLAIPPSERAWRDEGSTSLDHVQLLRSPQPKLSLPPAIILVRPQLGENIGKAARAMLNFGLTELRLVAPRDGWPNPSAGPAAASGV